jgi:carboxyl-terminal processing protease
MSRWNLAWLLGIIGAAVLGIAVSQSAPLRQKDKDYELVELFVNVLDEVENKYARELSDDQKRKLVEDMINGGLERLDPHSTFINAHRYKQFSHESRGKFGGVGIQVVTNDRGILTVVSPLVGTPAYEAGVCAGDLILKIDGKSTDTMQSNEAVEMIQGEPGEKVKLTLLHEGAREPTEVELTRSVIHVQNVMADQRKSGHPEDWDYMIDRQAGIAYIRLVTFSETIGQELRKAIEQCQAEGMRALILDLRNNPGGLLKSAVEISNLFIDDGRIVSTRGRTGQEDVYDAESRVSILPDAGRCPLVILVNQYSASASEIVAACLQDHQRAVIIGERSYGKGSVQNVIKMENGTSALKLTTASYWRPSGHNIHRFPDSKDTDEWGVKPTKGFNVPMTAEERQTYFFYRRDRDIVRGKNNVAGESLASANGSKSSAASAESADHKAANGEAQSAQTSGKKPKDATPFVDRTLNKALDFLRSELKKTKPAPVG